MDELNSNITFSFGGATSRSPSGELLGVIDANGPTMPTITLSATLDSGFSVLALKYEVTVSYTGHGRNDHPSVLAGQGASTATIHFAELILGGALTGRADVHIRRPNGTTYWTGWLPIGKTIPIIGSNPDKTALMEAAANIPPLIIAQLRSGLLMFDEAGQPAFNAGFGLFAIPAPEAGDVWNWRSNLARGLTEFTEHQSAVARYPQQLRESSSDYKGLTDYNEREAALETYQSYSTGRYWLPVKKGIIFRKWHWEKDKQGNGFADRCKQLEAQFPG